MKNKLILQNNWDIKEINLLREKIINGSYQMKDFANLFTVVRRNTVFFSEVRMIRLCELVILILTSDKKDINTNELLEQIREVFKH